MKLSLVLEQFLFTHKRLTLSGIGRFLIGDIYKPEAEKSVKGKDFYTIKFEPDTTAIEDKELISFYSVQTGKMQSLAASDLDSYLELVKQFLNIGKPFLIEGIGTLSKNKSGQYEFTPVRQFNEKIKDLGSEEIDQTLTTENSFTDYEEMFSPKKPSTITGRKITIWLALIAGLILAIWGGYIIYNKSSQGKKKYEIELKNKKGLLPDSIKVDSDSIKYIHSQAQTDAYRFVIEKAGKERAIARFNDLKKWGIEIKMETQDSVLFKLFFILPALPSDTARIRDSLGLLYSTKGRTYIEQ